MQAAHRVAKNTAILYGRMAITVFISLYATRLVLSALGAADFGLFNVVGGVIAMLGFLNASMAAATQRFISFAQGAGDLEKVKRIFNMSTILHIVIAIVLVLVLEIVGYFFFHGVLKISPDRISVARLIYQFMVVSTFFTVISVPYEAVITSHENMLLYAILGIAESLLKLGIAFYITYSAYDHLVIYGLLMAILSVLLLVIRRIYCNRKYPECEIKFKKYYDRLLLKELGGFAGWSFLGTSSSMLSNYGLGIVLNIFFGTIINAAQGITNQINGMLGVFATTLIKALNPMIDKTEGSGNRNLMLKASLLGCKVSFFLLLFMYIPFWFEMPYLLHIWLKDIPEYLIVFCRIALFRNLIDQITIPLLSAISAVGEIKRFQLISSIINFFPLIISFLLFKIGFPPYTIYVLFLLYALINGAVIIYFAKEECGLSVLFFVKNILLRCTSVLAISVLLTYSTILVNLNGVYQLSLVVIISTLVLLTSIWFFGLEGNEKGQITKLINLIFLMNGKLIKYKIEQQ